jgi:hypothetical protein
MTDEDKEDEHRLLEETREKLKHYKNFDINSLYQDTNYNTDNVYQYNIRILCSR